MKTWIIPEGTFITLMSDTSFISTHTKKLGIGSSSQFNKRKQKTRYFQSRLEKHWLYCSEPWRSSEQLSNSNRHLSLSSQAMLQNQVDACCADWCRPSLITLRRPDWMWAPGRNLWFWGVYLLSLQHQFHFCHVGIIYQSLRSPMRWLTAEPWKEQH